MTVKLTQLPRCLRKLQGIRRRPAATPDHASTPPSAARQLDPDVGCLYRGDRHDPWLQPELVSGLARDQRHDPVRTGLHLDLGRDAILDHARDDPNEAIAGRV